MDPVRPVLLFAFMFSLIDVLGQDLFAPEVPIGPNIAGIESPFPCDIDGDGLNEVILGSTRHGEVVALKFDGDTVSSLLRLLPDQAPSDLMLVVDMNLDGHPDLIRSRLSGDTALQIPRIAVYLGQVGGSFMEPIFRQGAYSLNGAMADDLTGDGHAEIIVQDDYGFHVYVLDEDAGEIELLRTFDQFQPGAKVSTGDVTGDGVPDLIFATSEWWYSSIEYWDATLGPDAPLVLLDSSFGEIGPLGHADFNGDGLTDLFAGGGPGFSHTSCLFWTQTAGSTFVRTVDTLDFFFSDNFQFRSAQDGTSMYYDRYGNLTHVRIHPDLTFGAPDTLHLQPTNPLSFCLADMDGDTAAELLTISRDGRLSMAHGLMAPDTFGIPVEVFSWNDGYTGPMVAIDPGQDATEELAFMSNQFDYPHLTLLHSLVPDPQKPVPAMTRTPMATGDWRQGHAEMQLMDIDSDGDSGLVGYMDFFGPYTPCQIFCMEPTGGTFAGHCLGTGLVQPTGLNAYRFDQLTIFDVNGDGPKDLLMEGTWVDLMVPAVQDPDEFVLTQTAPLLFELASAPMAIADYAMHHDLDEDGLEELLVQANPSELTVYHNDGGGNFTALPPLTTDHYVTGTWVDMNQDGVLDNIWSSHAGDSVHTYFNTVYVAGMTMQTVLLSFPSNDYAKNIQIADIEGDGDQDILFSQWMADDQKELFIYINQGSFPLTERVPVNGHFENYVPLDADGDGDRDLVCTRGAGFYLLENLMAPEPELASSGQFNIFPNPGIDGITVDIGHHAHTSVHFFVIDLSGRQVLQATATSAVTTIKVDQLPSGMYVLRAIDNASGERIATARFMVARSK